MKNFEKKIEVRWADCDPNRHLRHSAYYDYGGHLRIKFFEQVGFDSAKMQDLNIGPILFKEECSFIKEILPSDTVLVNILKGEVSDNAARWVLHHEMFNGSGEKCAQISIKGAWMDLSLRKLTIPPVELASAFHALEEGEYFTYKKTKQ